MPLQLLLVILAIAAASYCAPVKGAENAPDVVWAEQFARTPKHSFVVRLDSYGEDKHAAKAIRVVDRETGAPVQEIEKIDGLDLDRPTARFVLVVDANADGHADVQLAAADGGAGPNNTNFFYLFDPKAGQYVFHAELSELTQSGVAPDGMIESASRGGCCQHGKQTHRFIDGKLTLIKSWDRSLTTDGKWLEVTTGVLKNGKMRYKTTRRRPPANY